MTTMTVKIQYEDSEIESSISIDRWDLNIVEFIEELVVPILRSVGYCEKSIRNHILEQ